MARTLLAFLLSGFLTVEPCFAQFSQEQMRKSSAENGRMVERFREAYKQRYEKALVDFSDAKDPAIKIRIETFAAKTAITIATSFERPDPTTDLKPDFVQARAWYALATKHGDTYGAYLLGEMYWDGRGGSADRDRAKALWVWSAENGERSAVARLEGLGFNMQKERELAFGKAKAPRTQQDDANDAAKGFMLVLGALLVARLAHDINETPECREYRLANLAGTASGLSQPVGCY